MGLFWEDFEPGRSFTTGARTVTADDIEAFAALSGDHNAIHLDPAAARAAGFPAPIAHGALAIAVATGLVSRAELTRGTLLALLELHWRFLAPVCAGDTITVHLRVMDRRESRRADRGTIRLEADLVNQRGESVQRAELTELVLRRPN